MEWLSCIKKTISYIEDNLTSDIDIEKLAKEVGYSYFFLNKGFKVMTGYSISEYIRNRRLYEAAIKIKNSDIKIIDIAYEYGYNTPESFTKAFNRFHNVSPSDVRNGETIVKFLPLIIDIKVSGGFEMDYKVVNLYPMKLIGFEKVFEEETSYLEIPKWWDEICDKYCANIYAGNEPTSDIEQAIVDNCIGEYAVCIDDLKDGKFRYMIAGKYCGGKVPEGMRLYELKNKQWAIFNCVGPIPYAMQEINTQIFKEWLPGNPDYELSGNCNIEWYDCINGEKSDDDYHSAIWIPVKKKNL